MLILWIRKTKTGAPAKDENKETFKKHDADMKEFSLNHPNTEAAEPGDFITKEGLVFAPVHWVKLNKNVQN